MRSGRHSTTGKRLEEAGLPDLSTALKTRLGFEDGLSSQAHAGVLNPHPIVRFKRVENRAVPFKVGLLRGDEDLSYQGVATMVKP